LTPETRAYIKENSLLALAVDKKRPTLVGALVSHLACVELARNMWPECIPKLLENSLSDSDTLRETSLETIGFIFEEIADVQVLDPHLDDVFSMIEMCLQSPNASDYIKMSALSIITGSEAFISQFFIARV
jgi:importin subunit beta-1